MSKPPAVVIRIELEAAPRIYRDVTSNEESSRLLDWVNANDDLANLFHYAVQVVTDWERREHQRAA